MYNITESRDKILLRRHRQKLRRRNLFFKIPFILRRPRVAILTDIIKIVTMFIKKIF